MSSPFVVAHLAASSCLGGPESQLLGLVGALPETYRSVVLSFSEGRRCRPLLEAARALGAETRELTRNAPHYRAAIAEVAGHLRQLGAGVLCCHGYKPDILGHWAARRVGIPAVGVAHGWTAATWKVRANELADRLTLRRMARVACVSEAQAGRVRRAGVAARKVVVIPNAVDISLYETPVNPSGRAGLLGLFPEPPEVLVGAVGRLSPEKGFDVLVNAAALVAREFPRVGFAQFGSGPLRETLARQITRLGLDKCFVLGGFRDDLPRVLPHLDVLALPSHTEGLPCVVLEAFAAGRAVVATAVGGTPEVVADGVNGRLVPAGSPAELARALVSLLADPEARARMGANGRALVRERHTFTVQSQAYQALFEGLRASAGGSTTTPRRETEVAGRGVCR